MSFNEVIFSGRIGKDPELKKSTTGKSVCEISVAEEQPKDDERPTNWQRVQVWNQSAEWLAQNKKAGDKIFIKGRLQTDQWEKDGERKTKTYIIAERVEDGPSRSTSTKEKTMANESVPGGKNTPAEFYESKDEDLPF